MPHIATDICVIGAGSGGLSVAAGAVQMGARVVLIEGAEMGGDCLNAGCVPSKALIAAAKAAEAQRKGFRGVAAVEPRVDFATVKDHVAAVIARIAPVDSQERFEGLGCTVIRAMARFTGPREVQAGDHAIRARRFVIATGSRPVVPPISGIEAVPILTNETVFALRERPAHLIVLGGGPIGVEMAQAHRRLGCEVTVLEAAKILGREDPEAAAMVAAQLKAEGIALLEGQPVVRLAGSAGAIEATLGDGTQVRGSHLLVAVGRKVALDGLGLDAAGIAHGPGGISVTQALRSTTNRRVYAVGDAAGGLQFTHVAGWHAGIVVRQIVLGLPARADPRAIPRVTYTDPELAQVGLTEAEARQAHGASLAVVRADLDHNDRAQTEGRASGFAKVMVVKGRAVGATIVGPQAGELIGLWALAIGARLKLSAIAGMVAPYPTLGEVSKRAAGAYFTPRLFGNPLLRRIVRLVQAWVP
ncbi:MAG: FAD-dependent oxidoreductase [Paracoccaceae bacterium]|nr:FAD-dependent oxidoreductase [Paracoccaceae bacterium]